MTRPVPADLARRASQLADHLEPHLPADLLEGRYADLVVARAGEILAARLRPRVYRRPVLTIEAGGGEG